MRLCTAMAKVAPTSSVPTLKKPRDVICVMAIHEKPRDVILRYFRASSSARPRKTHSHCIRLASRIARPLRLKGTSFLPAERDGESRLGDDRAEVQEARLDIAASGGVARVESSWSSEHV